MGVLPQRLSAGRVVWGTAMLGMLCKGRASGFYHSLCCFGQGHLSICPSIPQPCEAPLERGALRTPAKRSEYQGPHESLTSSHDAGWGGDAWLVGKAK